MKYLGLTPTLNNPDRTLYGFLVKEIKGFEPSTKGCIVHFLDGYGTLHRKEVRESRGEIENDWSRTLESSRRSPITNIMVDQSDYDTLQRIVKDIRDNMEATCTN
jgi:hypothetical protein